MASYGFAPVSIMIGSEPAGVQAELVTAKRIKQWTFYRRNEARLHWIAAFTTFKAVLLEGLEVVFIVIALGSGRGMLVPASVGAVAACLLVAAVGLIVHRPLARVPENTLKFAVGIMLSAVGVFWTGEGLGVDWPGADLAIVGFAAMFLAVSGAAVVLAGRSKAEALS